VFGIVATIVAGLMRSLFGLSASGGAPVVSAVSTFSFTVGPNGQTNPTFQVDDSAANCATGLKVTGKAAGSGAALDALSSGVNEALTINAKGSGNVTIGNTSTGTVNIGAAGGVHLDNQVTVADAVNFGVNAATGTKIGTATTQKLGFWNATPVVQYATTGTATGFTAGAGTAVNDASTFTGGLGATAYRISDMVKALKTCGIMAQ
jgi:hypothetical protein